MTKLNKHTILHSSSGEMKERRLEGTNSWLLFLFALLFKYSPFFCLFSSHFIILSSCVTSFSQQGTRESFCCCRSDGNMFITKNIFYHKYVRKHCIIPKDTTENLLALVLERIIRALFSVFIFLSFCVIVSSFPKEILFISVAVCVLNTRWHAQFFIFVFFMFSYFFS